MLNITPIPAFTDNYIWLLHDTNSNQALVVDPGQAAPVITTLEKTNCQLVAILITHHHFDHTGGVNELAERYNATVYGPAHDGLAHCDHFLTEKDTVSFEAMQLSFKVLDIPGHTKGHIAYLSNDLLFCGDTLFTGGCGRIFEGTPQQMFNSLSKLARLPEETKVYCAHEYTLNNLKFAQAVEPNNKNIQTRISDAKAKRANNIPTVPSTLALEIATNPFLRSKEQSVIKAAESKANQQLTNPADVFATIRAWKDSFS